LFNITEVFTRKNQLKEIEKNETVKHNKQIAAAQANSHASIFHRADFHPCSPFEFLILNIQNKKNSEALVNEAALNQKSVILKNCDEIKRITTYLSFQSDVPISSC
jgi:hypothetical protein